jgi:phage/plasmid-like protein (TIGR03299 family)
VLGENVNTRNLDDALRAASLDNWKLSKRPVVSFIEEISEEGVTRHEVTTPHKFAVVGNVGGERKSLGIVGDRYTIVQNEAAFGFVRDLLDVGGESFVIEHAGSMHDGRKVFLDVKLPKTIMVGGHDPVDVRLLAVNTHDGTSPFMLSLHINRLFCTNQIETIRRNAKSAQQHWSLRHTASIDGRVELAREQLQLTVAAVTEFEAQAQELIAHSINDRQVDRLIDSTFVISHDATAKARDAKLAARAAVRTIYRDAPTQEGIRGTAWGLLNAFVEYADWNREVRVPKRSSLTPTEARAMAQLDSRHVANFKAQVMGRVLAMR